MKFNVGDKLERIGDPSKTALVMEVKRNRGIPAYKLEYYNGRITSMYTVTVEVNYQLVLKQRRDKRLNELL